MKVIMQFVLVTFLFIGCSPAPQPQIDTNNLFPTPLPENWTMNISTDSKHFRPLEALTGALAELTLVNESITLKLEIGQGRIHEYHPNIILKVFPKSRLEEIEQAVKSLMASSRFPPIIFGSTDKYVYVTSPGAINNGNYSHEAIAVTEELKNSLKESIEFKK